jgi:hypothetical protein
MVDMKKQLIGLKSFGPRCDFDTVETMLVVIGAFNVIGSQWNQEDEDEENEKNRRWCISNPRLAFKRVGKNNKNQDSDDSD